jgi:hypothetical protein
MYVFTPQEIRQIHEERVGIFQNYIAPSHKIKMGRTPRKWSLRKLFKRNDA